MRFRTIKLLVLSGAAIAVIWCIASTNRSRVLSANNDYVGSDACKDCHEDQFKAFSHTSHAGLAKISSWKEKVIGFAVLRPH